VATTELFRRLAAEGAMIERLSSDSRRAAPGTAFFALFTRLIQEGTTHRGLAEALAGSGFDIEAAASAAGCNVSDRLRRLLTEAQAAGAVDPAVTFADLKALTAGCLAYDGPDPDRVIEVICRGLRPVSGKVTCWRLPAFFLIIFL